MALLFLTTALTFATAGMVLLLAAPDFVLVGFGHAWVRAVTHLFTLGVLLSGAYWLLHRTWARVYGAAAPPARLLAAAWACHVAGVVLLAWGFFALSTGLAYWGGHYLVPTAVVLLLIHGGVAARRREAGRPRHLWSQVPGMGMFLAMAIGALLVMDARYGTYGIYAPGTILVHLLAGGYLFLLPLLLPEGGPFAPDAAGESAGSPAPDGSLELQGAARLLLPLGAASVGVLLVALGLMREGGAMAWGLPLGLAVLGGVGLWIGLPLPWRDPWGTLEALRRSGWVAAGLVTLLGAIRVARGADVGERFTLAGAGVLVFLLGLALPDVLARLALAAGQGGALAARSYRVQLTGSVLLLAGYLARGFDLAPWLVRAGALVWLLGLAGPALFALGLARRTPGAGR